MVNIPDAVDQYLLVNNDLREYQHIPSGKLSAGGLSLPLQWQVLHYLGIERAKHQLSTIHKFHRGNVLEDALIQMIVDAGHKVESKVKVEYRNAIGYLDMYLEEHPYEIKSVASNEWKRLKEAKWGHILQACFYALGLEKPFFSVLYVKPDTFEVKQFDYVTELWKPKVDSAIDTFEIAVENFNVTGEVPGFEPREHWHRAESVNPFPKFMGFTMPFKLAIK